MVIYLNDAQFDKLISTLGALVYETKMQNQLMQSYLDSINYSIEKTANRTDTIAKNTDYFTNLDRL